MSPTTVARPRLLVDMPSCPQAPDSLTSSERLRAIRQRLADWTDENLPLFPWRLTSDPYAIWVAAVMLQQTRIVTVLPYYRRFLSRFPTLPDLAGARLDDVLKAWEGLGYYARAHNLHRAARFLVEHGGSKVPSDRDLLLGLPGVGAYTAGAILSIAFGIREPAVDGNVRRILCRLFAIDSDPGRSATRRSLRDLACRLLPATGAGDFNQGLMQFGAVLCTARRPQCSECPLAQLCESQRRGLQEELPRRTPRRPVPHYDVTAAVIWADDGKVLIAKRDTGGMLGGLWEFPGGKCRPGESLPDCLRREIREELGMEITVGTLVIRLQHAYSHFRITLHAFDCRPAGGVAEALGCADWRWVEVADLSGFAFPVTDQKVIAALVMGKP